MYVNLVVVKILGKAGTLFGFCLVKKCVFALSMDVLFVVFLSAHVYLSWYLFVFLW